MQMKPKNRAAFLIKPCSGNLNPKRTQDPKPKGTWST